MLKKAGIVVAAAAAGLLAVSPLAFAGDSGKGGYEGGHHHGGGSDKQINNVEGNESSGLINIADNEVNVPIQACDNNVNVLGVQVADVTAALGLLGSGQASDDDSCKQSNSSGGNVLQNNS